MANIKQISLPDGTTYNFQDEVSNYASSPVNAGNAVKTNAILYGKVDSTSTSTVFTATVPGLTELYDGACVMLKNGVVTSATNFTLNINNLGAKPVYNNMAAATRESTGFNINYTILFVYDSTRVEGGGWIYYRGYFSDQNTIGYQLRTNAGAQMQMSDYTNRYRIFFTSADGEKWVPSTTSTSTNATAKRDVNQRPIDPFGEIMYYNSTTAVSAGGTPGVTTVWQQYIITLGYAFNTTGAALVLEYPKPVYIKCTPQPNGSAIIDPDTPYVQDLPTTEDGKIYIYLGLAYNATQMEVRMKHPVYWYHNGTVCLWTGKVNNNFYISVIYDDQADEYRSSRTLSEIQQAYFAGMNLYVVDNLENYQEFMEDADIIAPLTKYHMGATFFETTLPRSSYFPSGELTVQYYIPDDMDGVMEVQFIPLQKHLVSGTNIKTINNESILGSGNITISGGGSTPNNGMLTIQRNGTTVQTFTADQSTNVTANITVPTQASDINAQPVLVSGTNIKTVNNESLLGSGNIAISGGGSAMTNQEVDDAFDDGWGQYSLSGIDFYAGFDGSDFIEQITSANEGDRVYFWQYVHTDVVFVPSVSKVKAFGDRWYFIMPNSNVTATVTELGGGGND